MMAHKISLERDEDVTWGSLMREVVEKNLLFKDSGAKVKAGQVLVELDTSVERAQLESLAARRDLAESNAARTRELAKEGKAVVVSSHVLSELDEIADGAVFVNKGRTVRRGPADAM